MDYPKEVKEIAKESDLGDGGIFFLYNFTVNNFKKEDDWALELGVCLGRSTRTILYALDRIKKGLLISVDNVLDHRVIRTINFIKNHPNLKQRWLFIKEDDKNFLNILRAIIFGLKTLKPSRFVFIDTSHEFNHTLIELFTYSHFTNDIFLHDTELPSVRKAIDLFLKIHNQSFECKEYGFLHGFAHLRRKKPLEDIAPLLI